MLQLSLEMLQGIPKNGYTDPIEYYRRPLVGKLFRDRINLGLALLGEQRFGRALEVGYGAGAVLLSLAPAVDELHGIDLDADPTSVTKLLSSRGTTAQLRQGSVYELPYDDSMFDLVASFSVFEHLHEYRRALSEVSRVLRPGGLFLLGMPSVNKVMEAGFYAIGCKDINDHHVTTPRQVSEAVTSYGFSVKAKDVLGLPLKPPLGIPLYHLSLLKRT